MKLIAKTQIVDLKIQKADMMIVTYVRLFLLRYDYHVCFLYLRIDGLYLGDWHHDGLHLIAKTQIVDLKIQKADMMIVT
jgi:NOL1/NOP2/fmu family ribosome biogenesis protein